MQLPLPAPGGKDSNLGVAELVEGGWLGYNVTRVHLSGCTSLLSALIGR